MTDMAHHLGISPYAFSRVFSKTFHSNFNQYLNATSLDYACNLLGPMFNPNLTAFVCAVDSGSFTKAAKKLFVTPTAVMKQINSLESHLNLKLIERTKQGIHLTPSGEVIYKDAKFLFDFSRRSIENARQAEIVHDKTFCVGTSLLNPAKPFMDLWYKVSSQFPDYKLHLVPFEDDHDGILSEVEQLGEKFDFLLGVCDSKQWLERCNMVKL